MTPSILCRSCGLPDNACVCPPLADPKKKCRFTDCKRAGVHAFRIVIEGDANYAPVEIDITGMRVCNECGMGADRRAFLSPGNWGQLIAMLEAAPRDKGGRPAPRTPDAMRFELYDPETKIVTRTMPPLPKRLQNPVS